MSPDELEVRVGSTALSSTVNVLDKSCRLPLSSSLTEHQAAPDRLDALRQAPR